MQTEKRRPSGLKDHLALALTTFGVGYIPGAPGTYGSAIGVGLYFFVAWGDKIIRVAFWPKEYSTPLVEDATIHAVNAVLLIVFCLVGIWASGRSIAIFGTDDPHQAVVDEVIGQLITFLFIPFTASWPLIIAGFVLFRLFDIWKPYPIDLLQDLPGGLGICADDIVAGVYAGVCLSVIYAFMLSV
jgi:phosphatidylglycerophosphatase A